MLLEIHKIFLNLVRKSDINLSVTNDEGGQVNIKNPSLAETIIKRLKVINYIKHPKMDWGVLCDIPTNTFNCDLIDLNKTLISLKVNNNYTINIKLQYGGLTTLEITKFNLFIEVVRGKYEKVSISEEGKLITNVKTFNEAPWISISLLDSGIIIKNNDYPIEQTQGEEVCGSDVRLFSADSDWTSRKTAFPEIRELVVDIIKNNIQTNPELYNIITEMIDDGD